MALNITQDWFIRVGDANNFINSSSLGIWGIQSTTACGKYFCNNVRVGDRLWFIKSKSDGLIIAVAKFTRLVNRQLNYSQSYLTRSNEELGWTQTESCIWTSDMEVHYENLLNIQSCRLLTKLKCQSSQLLYKSNRGEINLPETYNLIMKFRNITDRM